MLILHFIIFHNNPITQISLENEVILLHVWRMDPFSHSSQENWAFPSCILFIALSYHLLGNHSFDWKCFLQILKDFLLWIEEDLGPSKLPLFQVSFFCGLSIYHVGNSFDFHCFLDYKALTRLNCASKLEILDAFCHFRTPCCSFHMYSFLNVKYSQSVGKNIIHMVGHAIPKFPSISVFTCNIFGFYRAIAYIPLTVLAVPVSVITMSVNFSCVDLKILLRVTNVALLFFQSNNS